MTDKVTLGVLSTGVPGLDALLGGGLSEFSFNLLAGPPGSGKTTLAHQIMFALANPDRRALFFTVLGEPPIKMLRYQQQYSFFDLDKVGKSVRYVNLAEDLRAGDFSRVLERIIREVEAFSPGLVFVDSFRSVVQTAKPDNEGIADLQQFVQELGNLMASWQATTFLIGEYVNPEAEANPIFTVADGLLSLSQSIERNAVLRKIRVVKVRGQSHLPGFHTFRISQDGLRVYPRLLPSVAELHQTDASIEQKPERISTGTPQLDDLLCGGLPRGHSVLMVGPTGSGKTIMATNFLAEGAAHGEKGVMLRFEKVSSRVPYAKLRELLRSGQVSIVQDRSMDMSIEELVDHLLTEIHRTQATRVVIDSLSEMSLYLAPEFKDDFRTSVFRLLAALARTGVSVVVTQGLEDRFTDMRFSHSDLSFLTDAVIAMRYVEAESQLKKVMTVVKVRGSAHSHDLREYQITDKGIEIAGRLAGYEGLLSGRPTNVNRSEKTD
jgi:circadian clock protein KaiC